MNRRWFIAASAVLAAVALGFLGYALSALGSSGPSRPRAVPGFDRVGFRVHGPGAPPRVSRRTGCALLADTEARRERGLSSRRDLGGYDGMIFQFSSAGRTAFYMKGTLIPLSIAWFDPSGRFVNATDMVPCPSGQDCPLYYPAAPASTAIEVERGHLAALGIGPGSVISVGGPCVT